MQANEQKEITIEKVAEDILSLVIQSKAKKIKIHPQHVNRAHQAGHPCERYLVLSRTNWDKRQPHNVTLQERFDDGSALEKKEIQDLIDAGIQVVQQQRDFYDKELQLSGHIDGMIDWPGLGKIGLEIKTISSIHFTQINSVKDFLNHSFVPFRNYPAQILAYLYLMGQRYGLILLKAFGNVSGFPKKFLTVDSYDQELKEYFDQVREKLKRVNEHVEKGTLPYIEVDYSVCRFCNFKHICFPTKKEERALELAQEEEEVLEAIQTYLEKKEAASEYEAARKKISKFLQKKQTEIIFIGDFVIESKKVSVKEYTVPAKEYWRMSKIKKV